MENLTGLYPAFGAFSNDTEIDVLCELLERVGASFSDDLTADNTHLVCTLPKVNREYFSECKIYLISFSASFFKLLQGPKYDKALELNIPCVTPEFLKACEQQGRVQPATSFYINKT